MRLLIMRHGPAETQRAGQPDGERRLTERGREETAAAARGLARLAVLPRLIITSPLPRARETAELAAAGLGLVGSLKVDEALSAGARPTSILGVLRGLGGDLLVVGHNPDLSDLVSYLLAGECAVPIDFGKGGVVALQFRDAPRRREGVLLWYLRRRQLAMLAAG
ncbi:MAG: SixA phosphatase family protein [Chloroflexota bacterium]